MSFVLENAFFIPRVNCQSYKNSYSGYEEGGSKGTSCLLRVSSGVWKERKAR